MPFTRVCETCHVPFISPHSPQNRTRGRFCSPHCRDSRSDVRHRRSGPRIHKTCHYCGRQFVVVPSESRRGGGKLCSPVCAQKGHVRTKGLAKPLIRQFCEYCREPFLVKESEINRGNGRFCSRSCAHQISLDVAILYFWQHVEKSDDPDACWLWTAGGQRFGYGTITVLQVSYTTHRFSYLIHHGELIPYLKVNHTCHVPACINPRHLYQGTQLENMQDAKRAGRIRLPPPKCGSDSPHAKLNEEQVLLIRAKSASGASCMALAQEFGVTRQNIRHIVTRKNWKHLP